MALVKLLLRTLDKEKIAFAVDNEKTRRTYNEHSVPVKENDSEENYFTRIKKYIKDFAHQTGLR